MKTVTLTGMDETDLNQKQWVWQTTGSPKRIIKQWPDERLPMTMQAQRFGQKIQFKDQISRRLDYED
jgi:hypothetical protein